MRRGALFGMGRKNTPKEIIAKLNTEINAILAEPDMKSVWSTRRRAADPDLRRSSAADIALKQEVEEVCTMAPI